MRGFTDSGSNSHRNGVFGSSEPKGEGGHAWEPILRTLPISERIGGGNADDLSAESEPKDDPPRSVI